MFRFFPHQDHRIHPTTRSVAATSAPTSTVKSPTDVFKTYVNSPSEVDKLQDVKNALFPVTRPTQQLGPAIAWTDPAEFAGKKVNELLQHLTMSDKKPSEILPLLKAVFDEVIKELLKPTQPVTDPAGYAQKIKTFFKEAYALTQDQQRLTPPYRHSFLMFALLGSETYPELGNTTLQAAMGHEFAMTLMPKTADEANQVLTLIEAHRESLETIQQLAITPITYGVTAQAFSRAYALTGGASVRLNQALEQALQTMATGAALAPEYVALEEIVRPGQEQLGYKAKMDELIAWCPHFQAHFAKHVACSKVWQDVMLQSQDHAAILNLLARCVQENKVSSSVYDQWGKMLEKQGSKPVPVIQFQVRLILEKAESNNLPLDAIKPQLQKALRGLTKPQLRPFLAEIKANGHTHLHPSSVQFCCTQVREVLREKVVAAHVRNVVAAYHETELEAYVKKQIDDLDPGNKKKFKAITKQEGTTKSKTADPEIQALKTFVEEFQTYVDLLKQMGDITKDAPHVLCQQPVPDTLKEPMMRLQALKHFNSLTCDPRNIFDLYLQQLNLRSTPNKKALGKVIEGLKKEMRLTKYVLVLNPEGQRSVSELQEDARIFVKKFPKIFAQNTGSSQQDNSVTKEAFLEAVQGCTEAHGRLELRAYLKLLMIEQTNLSRLAPAANTKTAKAEAKRVQKEAKAVLHDLERLKKQLYALLHRKTWQSQVTKTTEGMQRFNAEVTLDMSRVTPYAKGMTSAVSEFETTVKQYWGENAVKDNAQPVAQDYTPDRLWQALGPLDALIRETGIQIQADALRAEQAEGWDAFQREVDALNFSNVQTFEDIMPLLKETTLVQKFEEKIRARVALKTIDIDPAQKDAAVDAVIQQLLMSLVKNIEALHAPIWTKLCQDQPTTPSEELCLCFGPTIQAQKGTVGGLVQLKIVEKGPPKHKTQSYVHGAAHAVFKHAQTLSPQDLYDHLVMVNTLCEGIKPTGASTQVTDPNHLASLAHAVVGLKEWGFHHPHALAHPHPRWLAEAIKLLSFVKTYVNTKEGTVDNPAITFVTDFANEPLSFYDIDRHVFGQDETSSKILAVLRDPLKQAYYKEDFATPLLDHWNKLQKQFAPPQRSDVTALRMEDFGSIQRSANTLTAHLDTAEQREKRTAFEALQDQCAILTGEFQKINALLEKAQACLAETENPPHELSVEIQEVQEEITALNGLIQQLEAAFSAQIPDLTENQAHQLRLVSIAAHIRSCRAHLNSFAKTFYQPAKQAELLAGLKAMNHDQVGVYANTVINANTLYDQFLKAWVEGSAEFDFESKSEIGQLYIKQVNMLVQHGVLNEQEVLAAVSTLVTGATHALPAFLNLPTAVQWLLAEFKTGGSAALPACFGAIHQLIEDVFNREIFNLPESQRPVTMSSALQTAIQVQHAIPAELMLAPDYMDKPDPAQATDYTFADLILTIDDDTDYPLAKLYAVLTHQDMVLQAACASLPPTVSRYISKRIEQAQAHLRELFLEGIDPVKSDETIGELFQQIGVCFKQHEAVLEPEFNKDLGSALLYLEADYALDRYKASQRKQVPVPLAYTSPTVQETCLKVAGDQQKSKIVEAMTTGRIQNTPERYQPQLKGVDMALVESYVPNAPSITSHYERYLDTKVLAVNAALDSINVGALLANNFAGLQHALAPAVHVVEAVLQEARVEGNSRKKVVADALIHLIRTQILTLLQLLYIRKEDKAQVVFTLDFKKTCPESWPLLKLALNYSLWQYIERCVANYKEPLLDVTPSGEALVLTVVKTPTPDPGLDALQETLEEEQTKFRQDMPCDDVSSAFFNTNITRRVEGQIYLFQGATPCPYWDNGFVPLTALATLEGQIAGNQSAIQFVLGQGEPWTNIQTFLEEVLSHIPHPYAATRLGVEQEIVQVLYAIFASQKTARQVIAELLEKAQVYWQQALAPNQTDFNKHQNMALYDAILTLVPQDVAQIIKQSKNPTQALQAQIVEHTTYTETRCHQTLQVADIPQDTAQAIQEALFANHSFNDALKEQLTQALVVELSKPEPDIRQAIFQFNVDETELGADALNRALGVFLGAILDICIDKVCEHITFDEVKEDAQKQAVDEFLRSLSVGSNASALAFILKATYTGPQIPFSTLGQPQPHSDDTVSPYETLFGSPLEHAVMGCTDWAALETQEQVVAKFKELMNPYLEKLSPYAPIQTEIQAYYTWLAANVEGRFQEAVNRLSALCSRMMDFAEQKAKGSVDDATILKHQLEWFVNTLLSNLVSPILKLDGIAGILHTLDDTLGKQALNELVQAINDAFFTVADQTLRLDTEDESFLQDGSQIHDAVLALCVYLGTTAKKDVTLEGLYTCFGLVKPVEVVPLTSTSRPSTSGSSSDGEDNLSVRDDESLLSKPQLRDNFAQADTLLLQREQQQHGDRPVSTTVGTPPRTPRKRKERLKSASSTTSFSEGELPRAATHSRAQSPSHDQHVKSEREHVQTSRHGLTYDELLLSEGPINPRDLSTVLGAESERDELLGAATQIVANLAMTSVANRVGDQKYKLLKTLNVYIIPYLYANHDHPLCKMGGSVWALLQEVFIATLPIADAQPAQSEKITEFFDAFDAFQDEMHRKIRPLVETCNTTEQAEQVDTLIDALFVLYLTYPDKLNFESKINQYEEGKLVENLSSWISICVGKTSKPVPAQAIHQLAIIGAYLKRGVFDAESVHWHVAVANESPETPRSASEVHDTVIERLASRYTMLTAPSKQRLAEVFGLQFEESHMIQTDKPLGLPTEIEIRQALILEFGQVLQKKCKFEFNEATLTAFARIYATRCTLASLQVRVFDLQTQTFETQDAMLGYFRNLSKEDFPVAEMFEAAQQTAFEDQLDAVDQWSDIKEIVEKFGYIKPGNSDLAWFIDHCTQTDVPYVLNTVKTLIKAFVNAKSTPFASFFVTQVETLAQSLYVSDATNKALEKLAVTLLYIAYLETFNGFVSENEQDHPLLNILLKQAELKELESLALQIKLAHSEIFYASESTQRQVAASILTQWCEDASLQAKPVTPRVQTPSRPPSRSLEDQQQAAPHLVFGSPVLPGEHQGDKPVRQTSAPSRLQGSGERRPSDRPLSQPLRPKTPASTTSTHDLIQILEQTVASDEATVQQVELAIDQCKIQWKNLPKGEERTRLLKVETQLQARLKTLEQEALERQKAPLKEAFQACKAAFQEGDTDGLAASFEGTDTVSAFSEKLKTITVDGDKCALLLSKLQSLPTETTDENPVIKLMRQKLKEVKAHLLSISGIAEDMAAINKTIEDIRTLLDEEAQNEMIGHLMTAFGSRIGLEGYINSNLNRLNPQVFLLFIQLLTQISHSQNALVVLGQVAEAFKTHLPESITEVQPATVWEIQKVCFRVVYVCLSPSSPTTRDWASMNSVLGVLQHKQVADQASINQLKAQVDTMHEELQGEILRELKEMFNDVSTFEEGCTELSGCVTHLVSILRKEEYPKSAVTMLEDISKQLEAFPRSLGPLLLLREFIIGQQPLLAFRKLYYAVEVQVDAYLAAVSAHAESTKQAIMRALICGGNLPLPKITEEQQKNPDVQTAVTGLLSALAELEEGLGNRAFKDDATLLQPARSTTSLSSSPRRPQTTTTPFRRQETSSSVTSTSSAGNGSKYTVQEMTQHVLTRAGITDVSDTDLPTKENLKTETQRVREAVSKQVNQIAQTYFEEYLKNKFETLGCSPLICDRIRDALLADTTWYKGDKVNQSSLMGGLTWLAKALEKPLEGYKHERLSISDNVLNTKKEFTWEHLPTAFLTICNLLENVEMPVASMPTPYRGEIPKALKLEQGQTFTLGKYLQKVYRLNQLSLYYRGEQFSGVAQDFQESMSPCSGTAKMPMLFLEALLMTPSAQVDQMIKNIASLRKVAIERNVDHFLLKKYFYVIRCLVGRGGQTTALPEKQVPVLDLYYTVLKQVSPVDAIHLSLMIYAKNDKDHELLHPDLEKFPPKRPSKPRVDARSKSPVPTSPKESALTKNQHTIMKKFFGVLDELREKESGVTPYGTLNLTLLDISPIDEGFRPFTNGRSIKEDLEPIFAQIKTPIDVAEWKRLTGKTVSAPLFTTYGEFLKDLYSKARSKTDDLLPDYLKQRVSTALSRRTSVSPMKPTMATVVQSQEAVRQAATAFTQPLKKKKVAKALQTGNLVQ